MKSKFVWISGLIVLSALTLYITGGYFVYDKLSKVTAGGGENSENTPTTFVNTVDEWSSFNVSPYFMPDFEIVRFPSRQSGLTLTGWFVATKPDAPAVILTHGFERLQVQSAHPHDCRNAASKRIQCPDVRYA